MSEEAAKERGWSLWRGWFLNQSVLRALILRELQSRYGRYNIGFFWVVVEPLILASIVTAIHAINRSKIDSTSFDPFAFTVTGYCLLIIFRSNFGRSAGALNEALPLLYHAQITPVDVIMARVACDTFGALSAYLLLMGLGILLGLADFPVRPLYTFLAIAEICVWTFGLSMAVATYAHKYHVLQNFVQPISYFSFPLSGAFFTMSFLPVWAREYMSWNPLAGMFETARYGQFEMASADYMYPGYVIAHCMLSLYWGFFAIRRARRDIHVV
jgi:capsular polysaccharide transport system permease protein